MRFLGRDKEAVYWAIPSDPMLGVGVVNPSEF